MLALILAIASVVVAVVVLLSARHFNSARAEARCATCGYAVRGLPSSVCPECGSDLREVGIVSPQIRNPLSPFVRILIWSLLLPLPAVVIDMFLPSCFIEFPTSHVSETEVMLQPRSGAYGNIIVSATENGGCVKNRPDAVQLLLYKAPRVHMLEMQIALPEVTYTSWDENWEVLSEGTERLDEKAVLAWMQTGGIAVDDTQVQAEAKGGSLKSCGN